LGAKREMTIPVWNPSYSVGNDILDNQHKKLLALCKEAENLYKVRNPEFSDKYHAIFDELCTYIQEHFRSEEELLEANEYPDLIAHKKEHNNYITNFSKIVDGASKGDLDINKLNCFLTEWWLNHILTSDMKYKDYFGKN
jgi:hemerythrin-like metal-binding protein